MKPTANTNKYRELKRLNLPDIDKEILEFWGQNAIFEKSVSIRNDSPRFIFFEGPPSVNGLPGIHHVMSRTIKDLFCRYRTLKGYQVHRKAGWDAHGLPIELAVEKKLGIRKEDIGKSISVKEYNATCRTEAVKYTDIWNDITQKMGYWVDMSDPYVTYEAEYVETLWHLLKQLYNKGLLYKGYTIQPYSPAAGTGLSSHELNMPGAYREVKDLTVTAQFKVVQNEQSEKLFTASTFSEVYFLAWTTTPWTLPSNTALAVGAKITYVQVDTYNPYTHLPQSVILAKDRLSAYFKPEAAEADFAAYDGSQKLIPYKVVAEHKGADLENLRFEQLLPYVQPTDGDAFKVISGNFVTTEDGTGIVHIAPSFGSDDMMMSKKYGLGTLTLVNKQGRFVDEVTDFAGRPVKNYDDLPEKEYRSVDIDIVIKLKTENKAFLSQKYEHNYPHCWRTDKPIVYYPLDSWFIRTTAVKDRMVELNKTINWKPASTGEGRFGNWLENLVDWNLSRSRYWGTPLPIWRSEDGTEEICIGSIAELRQETEKAVAAGFMTAPLPDDFDPHRPFVDEITLVSSSGKKMMREPDLIDVWFDSGAMPYAQWHYPFQNKANFEQSFPADFIAEGVDQTRGWFFTLHAIAVMLFDSVAYKNVVSNGLLLDKDGVKMSKRLGNVVNPFDAIATYGADAVRWYIISNSQPWDNIRFSLDGVQEVQRKFFGTLFNTYSFFALYANVDGFSHTEASIPLNERPEIDRWIISMLNSLVRDVDTLLEEYEPTRAARLVQSFVTDHLSNWYVRLCRRRFWKGEYNTDKIAAYQTLYECLMTVAHLMAPVSPFFADFLYRNLNEVTRQNGAESIHLSHFPQINGTAIDPMLEERMLLAQNISSMVLSLRKKVEIKVRQPLQKILIPFAGEHRKEQIERVRYLILSEVNVKEIEFVSDTSGLVTKNIKPDFKKLGRKLGKKMNAARLTLEAFTQDDIAHIEQNGSYDLNIDDEAVTIAIDEVIIGSEDIPGWQVNSANGLTVALDVNITEALKNEGLARELVNRLQRLRKEMDFSVTDRIEVTLEPNDLLSGAVNDFSDYICRETLAESLTFSEKIEAPTTIEVNNLSLKVNIRRK